MNVIYSLEFYFAYSQKQRIKEPEVICTFITGQANHHVDIMRATSLR